MIISVVVVIRLNSLGIWNDWSFSSISSFALLFEFLALCMNSSVESAALQRFKKWNNGEKHKTALHRKMQRCRESAQNEALCSASFLGMASNLQRFAPLHLGAKTGDSGILRHYLLKPLAMTRRIGSTRSFDTIYVRNLGCKIVCWNILEGNIFSDDDHN